MGGSSKAASVPSTTTQISDIPEWEQGYVTDLLGQAQTIAAQPYQQFPGQQIAGFTDNQNQAFSNIQNAGDFNTTNQNSAFTAANAGANSANGIYGSGAGYIGASTAYNPLAAVAPYLGAAAGYNSAAAAQPWLNNAAGYTNAAANAASPSGIQSYLSPYTNDVVKGIQDQANQNWSQNIMPGINDKFIGSGQYASGRNAQVLGREAGNFQTGLSANVANALETGYNTAGNQAATQANILGAAANSSLQGAQTASGAQTAQVGNLLNQGAAAGTATQQQAANLQNAGADLGNLAATQTGAQLTAGTTLGNLGSQAATTNLNQNQALAAVGQTEQQLNQSNLDVAQQNFQNQVNWPKEQTEYLNQIIRGLPAPAETTTSTQTTPAYSVSPLLGLGGASVAGLSALSAKKEGGLVEKFAKGGKVSAKAYDDEEDVTPLDYATVDDDTPSDEGDDVNVGGYGTVDPLSMMATSAPSNDNKMVVANDATPSPAMPVTAAPPAAANPLADATTKAPPITTLTPDQMQQNQLLALARGLLTPSPNGSPWASLGQGIGAMQDVGLEQQRWNAQQQALQFTRDQEAKRIAIEQQNADTNKSYREGILDKNTIGTMKMPDGSVIRYNKTTGEQMTDPNAAITSTGNGDVTKLPPSAANIPDDMKENLAKIPSLYQPTVLAVVQGRIPPDRAHLGMDPKIILNYVTTVDPNFDVANATQRMKTAQEYSQNGQTGKTITALNAASKHAAQLATNFLKQDNYDMPAANYVASGLKSQAGGGARNNSATTLEILAPEGAKVISGKSNFAEKEVTDIKSKFPLNGSKEQQFGALSDFANSMGSKAEELQNTYNDKMGPIGQQQKVVSPAVLQTFHDLQDLAKHAKEGTLDSPAAKKIATRLEKYSALQDSPDSAPAGSSDALAEKRAKVKAILAQQSAGQ